MCWARKAARSGPTSTPLFEFDGHYVLSADIEEWTTAVLWLSPCLLHIAGTLLAESLDARDGIGRFRSRRWQAFRKEAARVTTMEWKEILAGARREGVDFMADHIAACLVVESNLADRLRTA